MYQISTLLFLSFFPWTMNLSTADLRNYWTEFHETLWSYRYMFLVGPKVFSFVVKGPFFMLCFWQSFWKWQTSRKFWKRRIAPLMVTYHYVKFYVSIIIHLEVINNTNKLLVSSFILWFFFIWFFECFIKFPKQRLETYCFCSVSSSYYYYYYY
jgi:hypothetical protein